MASYFPGRGLKKPLNVLEAPIYPDIKKGPPRFVWTRKHWKVDTGRTMAEIEHIPQMMENNILYQSYDYNSQHAYGKFPTYDVFTNLEFRPPLIERDDILPLSRIPRPTVGIRINPGSAHPSGNSVFADSNMHLPGVEKYISDRVKAGEVRPTFFAPIDMPIDNSILPDLETTLPAVSASAGYRFPSIGKIEQCDKELGYKQFHPENVADVTPIYINAPDAREDMSLSYARPQISASSGMRMPVQPGLTQVDFDLEYNRPQVSASSGRNTIVTEGFTPVDIELDYNNPQVSASAGRNTRVTSKMTPVDMDLHYSRPQVSAFAGYQGPTAQGMTPVDIHLETKLAGSQPALAMPKMTAVYDNDHGHQDSAMKIGDSRPQYAYVVPSNTRYQATDQTHQPHFRQKAAPISSNNPQSPGIPQSFIPRAGISTPEIKKGIRK